MSMIKSVINVNGFAFCEEHGDEWCHMCTFDFRAGNNYFIVDELPPRLAKKLDEERPFYFNVYRVGGLHVDTRKEEPELKCRKHGITDCETCFDWRAMILKELEMLK